MLDFQINNLIHYQTILYEIIIHAQEVSKGEFSSKFLPFRFRSINGLISSITPDKEKAAPAM